MHQSRHYKCTTCLCERQPRRAALRGLIGWRKTFPRRGDVRRNSLHPRQQTHEGAGSATVDAPGRRRRRLCVARVPLACVPHRPPASAQHPCASPPKCSDQRLRRTTHGTQVPLTARHSPYSVYSPCGTGSTPAASRRRPRDLNHRASAVWVAAPYGRGGAKHTWRWRTLHRHRPRRGCAMWGASLRPPPTRWRAGAAAHVSTSDRRRPGTAG